MTTISANPQKTYALIVGIEKYGDPNTPPRSIRGPAFDAIMFTEWLLDREVPADNIFLCLSPLDDNKDEIENHAGKLNVTIHEATLSNIKRILIDSGPKSLSNQNGDLLILFWVGHGVIDTEKQERRLFFSDGTIKNAGNLYLESLFKSLRSKYFKISTQVCFINACANQPRLNELGGLTISSGEVRADCKQFILFSAKEGAKSSVGKGIVSPFCEQLLKILRATAKNIWPPLMEEVVIKLKECLEATQTPILCSHSYVRLWDGDQNPLIETNNFECLLDDMKQQSEKNRRELNPSYLERISRLAEHSDEDRYLKAIQSSLQEESRVIFIYAPAGYGKSVLLGEIYDRLIAANAGCWVALTLCSELIGSPMNSPEDLSKALSESLFNQKLPVDEITSYLNPEWQNRGVFLIDTLDLIFNSSLIHNFHKVLSKLLKTGVTIVCTCREEEYSLMKEELTKKLGAGVIHPLRVDAFNDKEISMAASAYIQKKKKEKEEKGEKVDDQIFHEFSRQIFAMTAGDCDSSQLKKIIQSPLLLSMLCELFSEKGRVDDNLTVSSLYEAYWREKITKHRPNQTEFDSELKENLCLSIAGTLFKIFRDEKVFQESINKNDLKINWTDQKQFNAREHLLSEGVLEWTNADKRQLRFFHQTFLEYVLARWLELRDSQIELDHLLDDLKNEDWANKNCYWYTIIRQLLTIIEDSRFQYIYKKLEIIQQSQAFKAVALAAASRRETSALQELLMLGLNLNKPYHQEILREAVVSVSIDLADPAYRFLIHVMATGQIQPAVNSAKAASAMLTQWWGTLSPQIEQAFVAIRNRSIISNDDRSEVIGWFLSDNFQKYLQNTPDTDTLKILRDSHDLLGGKKLIFLIRLHLEPRISSKDRKDLIVLLSHKPVPKDKRYKQEIEKGLVDLSVCVLRDSKITDKDIWFETTIPQSKGQKGWDRILADAWVASLKSVGDPGD